jgi:hypothetical protein
MVGRIEECIDICNGHLFLRFFSHLHDFVASTHLAFLQDTEVEPRPSAGCQQSRHAGLVHPDANAIAGNTRLGHFEPRAAALITIADAHGIVGQSFDREVLAELSTDEVRSVQLLLPIAVRFDLLHEDGALLTPVPGQVTLTVSVQIQPNDSTAARNRILPNPGVHSAPLPLDASRLATLSASLRLFLRTAMHMKKD